MQTATEKEHADKDSQESGTASVGFEFSGLH